MFVRPSARELGGVAARVLQVVLFGNDANMPEKQAEPRKRGRERGSRSVPVPYQTPPNLATPKRVVLELFLDHQVNSGELLDWLSTQLFHTDPQLPFVQIRSTAVTNIADLHDPTESVRIAILRFSNFEK